MTKEPSIRETRPLAWTVIIAAIILPASGVMYLVTTFLFAFSGGQGRMVSVVNLGAVVVVGLAGVVAVVLWRLRGGARVVKWTAIATGAGWGAAALVEWLLSFKLGAP